MIRFRHIGARNPEESRAFLPDLLYNAHSESPRRMFADLGDESDCPCGLRLS